MLALADLADALHQLAAQRHHAEAPRARLRRGCGTVPRVEDPRRAFESLFGRPRALLGMLHAGATPGTPTPASPSTP